MPIDPKKFKQKITEHFQNLTPEEFLKILSQSSPHLFDGSMEEEQDNEIFDRVIPNSTQIDRVSIRLKGFDYSSVASYFITICTQNRQCLFGNIESGVMIVNSAGQMIIDEWLAIRSRFSSIGLEAFVVMPNHFHGILSILPAGGESLVDIVDGGVPIKGTPTLGEMIGAFKSITTNRYISGVKNQNWEPFDRRLWQRNYYEHIIRNDRSFEILQSYIQDNPLRWEKDQLHPDVRSKW